MVQGLAQLERRMKRIPLSVREVVRKSMERAAAEIVADMEALKPIPEIEIGWTWGDAPAGSLVIQRAGSRDYGGMRITIYARGGQGSGFAAQWFEHGTNERFTRAGKGTGRIKAQPFVYPVWRAWRRRIRARISAAVRRGVKKL